jgi:hypothetical protein
LPYSLLWLPSPSLACQADLLTQVVLALELPVLAVAVLTVVGWPYRRGMAGRPLLRVDMSRERRLQAVLSGVATVAGLVAVVVSGAQREGGSAALLLGLLLLSVEPLELLDSMLTPRITEKDLLDFFTFTPWKDIRGLALGGKDGTRLVITLRRRVWTWYGIRSWFKDELKWSLSPTDIPKLLALLPTLPDLEPALANTELLLRGSSGGSVSKTEQAT